MAIPLAFDSRTAAVSVAPGWKCPTANSGGSIASTASTALVTPTTCLAWSVRVGRESAAFSRLASWIARMSSASARKTARSASGEPPS